MSTSEPALSGPRTTLDWPTFRGKMKRTTWLSRTKLGRRLSAIRKRIVAGGGGAATWEDLERPGHGPYPPIARWERLLVGWGSAGIILGVVAWVGAVVVLQDG